MILIESQGGMNEGGIKVSPRPILVLTCVLLRNELWLARNRLKSELTYRTHIRKVSRIVGIVNVKCIS